ncbi:hypothetical protein FRX31_008705, partial [Thalictrum thalictroides]
KPPDETIRINTDGAVCSTRNNEGVTILAYNGGSPSDSVLLQELDAIGYGLQGVDLLGVRNVEVATDSLKAQRIITGQEIS